MIGQSAIIECTHLNRKRMATRLQWPEHQALHLTPLHQDACGGAARRGGVKVMLAFGQLPPDRRKPLIDAAIQGGVEFLLGMDPAMAAYPTGYSTKPSQSWWKFGFPVFYVTEVLQVVEALVGLGYGGDPRLANALALVRSKQDAQGRWPMEYSYAGRPGWTLARRRRRTSG